MIANIDFFDLDSDFDSVPFQIFRGFEKHSFEVAFDLNKSNDKVFI